MFSIVAAIIAIGLLIVVHETGHYVVARWCKMRVDRFSLGFGPAILKWRRGETDFTLGPIPFGGFVQIHGMTIAEEVDPDDERSYPNRPVWQRFATIFAGPATNYLFAIVLAFGLYSLAGVDTGTSWYAVNNITTGKGYDAEGKLEQGDRILQVDGRPFYFTYGGERHSDLPAYVSEKGEQPIVLTVLRDGQEVQISVTPSVNHDRADEKEPAYRLGIELAPLPDDERARVGVLTAAGHAFAYPVRQTERIVVSLYEWARGEQEGRLVGPVGITTMIKRSIEYGWIRAFEFLMLLNVYLGLFNLLPLPALDGGRLVFLGYEMATRRRANPKVEATVHMVGIMAILLLLVVVTYREIADLVTRQF